MAQKEHGLRGSFLEEIINQTNEKYIDMGLALVQKIPTPIKPMQMKNGRITLAFFEEKSTVDYLGAVQGIPICFDAKECSEISFPLKNVHKHQLDFMNKMQKQSGVSFFIVYFKKIDTIYYVPYDFVQEKWDLAQNGGKKSFRYTELDDRYILKSEKGLIVPYLNGIQLWLSLNDK